MPLISVIIPIYNVEKYLVGCLDSILGQTFQEFELLLVDDGSTDKSIAIAKEYARNYPDKIFIHSVSHGGPGPARNYGIQKARGEYILFVDSDDYIDKEMFTALYQSASCLDSDIVIAPYFRHGLCQEITIEGTFDWDSYKTYSGIDFIKHTGYRITIWGKLYKTSFIKKYFFPAIWYEDVAWLPVVMSNSPKISYVPDAYYHYVRNDASIVSNISDKQVLGSLDAIQFIIEHSNASAQGSIAPFIANLLLYMCKRRPAFADRYIHALIQNKAYLLKNCDFSIHKKLEKKLADYFYDFLPIPKVLYYDNFGKQKLTDSEQETIQNWNGTLVQFDGEIICLDEENCNLSENPLILQAYQHGYYNLVGHYFKCRKLLKNGGIAICKNTTGLKYITPLLLRSQAFFGFYDDHTITAGIYAAAPGQKVIQDLLDLFEAADPSENSMEAILGKLFIEKEKLSYSYGLECRFEGKYLTAYENTVRVYATSVLARDYGIGITYASCPSQKPTAMSVDGKEYLLADPFYYQTLSSLACDYSKYQMDTARHKKSKENVAFNQKISKLRIRIQKQAAQNNQYKEENETLALQNETLIQQQENLKLKNKSLKEQNEKLREQREKLHQQRDKLKQEREKLTTELNSIKKMKLVWYLYRFFSKFKKKEGQN